MDSNHRPAKCVIENWLLVRVADQEFLYGAAVDDGYGRFDPGHYVFTSRITFKTGNWNDLQKGSTRQAVTLSGSIYEPRGPGRLLETDLETATAMKFNISVERLRELRSQLRDDGEDENE